jgi:hypothetical protein
MGKNILFNEREYDNLSDDELFDPYELIEKAIRSHYNVKNEYIELEINHIYTSGSDIQMKGTYLVKDTKLDERKWQGDFDILINEYFKIKKQMIE